MNSPQNLPISRATFFQSLLRFRFLLLAFAAALLLWNLNYAPVWNPDEGRYVSASLEMMSPLDASTPDWVVPHLNTLPRLNKPPLVYWCAATVFKIFGPSAASARLVSALSAIGVLLVIWYLGRAMFGEKAGVLAALIWTSSMLPFTLARMLSTDMLLSFSMCLALVGIYRLAERNCAANNPSGILGPILITGVGLGLALLAKGPVGVALPISILVAWLIIVQIQNFRLRRGASNTSDSNTSDSSTSDSSTSNSSTSNSSTPVAVQSPVFIGRILWGISGALLLAGVLAAPWYLAVARSHPEFLGKFLLGENIARLTGSKAYHDPKPIWFYVPVLIVGTLPWTFFLWPALKNLGASLFSPANAQASTPLQNRARWFLWLWAAAVISLFSISSTKLVTYILPALPALSILIADALAHRREEKPLRRAALATMIFLGALAVLLPFLFFVPKLLADKIIPRADALPDIALMSAILIGGAFGLWQALRARHNSTFAVRTASTLVATGAALFMALTLFMGRVAPYEDASGMLIALRPFLGPQDEVIQFKTFQPSAVFYTKAPSTVIDFVNTSGLKESRFHTSSLFPKDQQVLREFFQKPHRVYVLVRWKHAHWASLPPHFVVAANNDYRLLCNRPAPRGFSYEFVAPAKRRRVLSDACKNFSPDC